MAFSLIVLGLGACLILALGRGLLNVYDMYVHGKETSNQEGAHQAATMIKKYVAAFGLVIRGWG